MNGQRAGRQAGSISICRLWNLSRMQGQQAWSMTSCMLDDVSSHLQVAGPLPAAAHWLKATRLGNDQISRPQRT
jgi:hypothetical protein